MDTLPPEIACVWRLQGFASGTAGTLLEAISSVKPPYSRPIVADSRTQLVRVMTVSIDDLPDHADLARFGPTSPIFSGRGRKRRASQNVFKTGGCVTWLGATGAGTGATAGGGTNSNIHSA